MTEIQTEEKEVIVPIDNELKGSLDSIKNLFEGEFKKVNEEIAAMKNKGDGHVAGDLEQKLDRVIAQMEVEEGKGNRRVLDKKNVITRDNEVDDAVDSIERKGIHRMNAEQKSAFWNAMHNGSGNLSPNEKKSLIYADRNGEQKVMTVGNQTTGGFFAPSELVAEIIKGVKDYSPIRDLARVKPTSTKSSLHPRRDGTFSAAWEGESSTTTETEGLAYGMIEIPNHKLRAMVTVSMEDLEDAAFNLEQEIKTEASEQFGIAEGTGFANGTGAGQPEGLWQNADIGEVVSGSAAAITSAGLIDLYFELHENYWQAATFLMRRASLKSVRKLTDSNGDYLWTSGLQGSATPPTILGQPYRVAADAPAEGANAYPIMFGDFRKGYVISDRVAMSVKRDEYSNGAAEDDNVNFWFRKRVGGMVVQAEAIKKMKCST